MEKTSKKPLYQCPICKLHYAAKSWATKCETWCKKHPSCNLTIARHSIEAGKAEKKTVLSTKKSLPFNKLLILIPLVIFLATTFFLLQKLKNEGFLSFHLPFENQIATGYVKSGNYVNRMQAVFEEVNPKNGFESQIVLGDIIPRLVSYGVIDMTKMQQLYDGRGGIPKDEMSILTKPSYSKLTINGNNTNWIVNLLWAIGLSNNMEINKQSPVYGPNVNNFASTGGWQLGKEENGGAYFNKFPLIKLTDSQQKRVKMIADNTYRPCCNNSTFFQDCNHGSAAMALIELGVSQGLSDKEIYKTLLAFNSFWFPSNYNEIALYFNVIKNTDWQNVDPKLALSKDYSSISGWIANIDTPVHSIAGLLPKPQNGGSCGA